MRPQEHSRRPQRAKRARTPEGSERPKGCSDQSGWRGRQAAVVTQTQTDIRQARFDRLRPKEQFRRPQARGRGRPEGGYAPKGVTIDPPGPWCSVAPQEHSRRPQARGRGGPAPLFGYARRVRTACTARPKGCSDQSGWRGRSRFPPNDLSRQLRFHPVHC